MNEREQRLRIYSALTTSPEWVEIVQDALAIQEKKEVEHFKFGLWHVGLHPYYWVETAPGKIH